MPLPFAGAACWTAGVAAGFNAATLYTQVLAMQEKKWGSNSPQVATALNNLAVVYQDESKDAEADIAQMGLGEQLEGRY